MCSFLNHPSLCFHKSCVQTAGISVYDLRASLAMASRYSTHHRSLFPRLVRARSHYIFTSHAGNPLCVWDLRYVCPELRYVCLELRYVCLEQQYVSLGSAVHVSGICGTCVWDLRYVSLGSAVCVCEICGTCVSGICCTCVGICSTCVWDLRYASEAEQQL